MTQFLHHTMTDIRTGRETWRVFTAACSVAFALAIALRLI
jgi:hypothetical protein